MTEIEGLDKLQNKLMKLKGIKENKDALLAGALVLEAGVKEDGNVPVDTGFLKNSGVSRKTVNGAEYAQTAEYAYYQEFGTSRIPAHPYIRPAIENHANDIVEAVSNELSKDINDLGGG